MTALNLPYDLANQTDADATEVEQNFNTIQSYVNGSVIRSDGAVAMAAALQLFGDPVGDDDAARKAYVDAILPVGVILPFGGTAAPAGSWAICNGASLSTTTYATLFAQLSYNYGGSGGSFSIPDLQGRVPVGVSGVAPFNTLGDTGGSEDAAVVAHTHGTTSHNHSMNHGHGDNIAVSNHTFTGNGSTPYDMQNIAEVGGWPTSGSAGVLYGNPSAGGGLGSRLPPDSSLWDTNGSIGISSHSVTGGVTNHTGSTGNASPNTDSTGSSGTNANLPPYVVVNYIIRVD